MLLDYLIITSLFLKLQLHLVSFLEFLVIDGMVVRIRSSEIVWLVEFFV